jgi:hypothetical protein
MSPNASTSTFDFEPIQDLAIARANEFDVLDERIEWEKFSKSISDTDINPVWKSHIVIEGMHCAACAFQIEDVLKKTPGVLDVQVDASSHRANVTWIENTSKPSVWMDRLKLYLPMIRLCAMQDISKHVAICGELLLLVFA